MDVCIVDRDRQLSAYDYVLPPEQIAQSPAEPRDAARLLVVPDQVGQTHAIFRELPQWLQPGDLLVLNNTRVLPARLYGHKESGLTVEILLLEPRPLETIAATEFANRWLALVKPGRRLKPGTQIGFADTAAAQAVGISGVVAQVVETDAATSGRILEFSVPAGEPFKAWLYAMGQVPLPPYIQETEAESERYQTVYGDRVGAVAAPTAGLHFTPELLQTLRDRGIQHAFITLHVGVGTFRPVEAEDITAHAMHSEWAEVPPDTVAQIQAAKAQGGRIIAVGTTAVRALEGAAQTGQLQPFCGRTNLFIYPGYDWRVVDGLITNFHLPKSSLLMLVSALIGRERLLALYAEAIAAGYRFYSFGDAMLILPAARVYPA